MTDLDATRRLYAEEIRIKAGLRSEALAAAFATVPREHYLGPGPWLIKKDGRGLLHRLVQRLRGEYRATDDSDPRRIYRDVHVAIDPRRGLNNGRPSSVSRLVTRRATVAWLTRSLRAVAESVP